VLFRRKNNVRHATVEAQRLARRRQIFRMLVGAIYVAIAVLLVLGLGHLRRYLLTTPRLALRTIEVSGTNRVTPWEVRVLGGIENGRNLLSIDLEVLAPKIEQHPWIAQVVVRRVLPDRLQIEIEEREPVALLAMKELYYVDAGGSVFKRVKPGEALSFPVLTGFEESALLQRGPIGRQAIREALELLGRISSRTKFTRDQISEIHVDPTSGFSVYTAVAGAQIHLGWDQFDRKLDRLVRLLDQERLDLAQVRRIDMDLTRWAVVTPM